MQFREEQKDILTYKKGIMAVSAVPGAGKTFILVYLIKNLLENHMEKDKKILMLTYMNSAVDNFHNRISLEAPKSILSHLEVKTIHSLSQELLNENSSLLELYKDFYIIDTIERNNLLLKICRNHLKDHIVNFKYLFKDKEFTSTNQRDFQNSLQKNIGNLISKFKMEGIGSHKIFSETSSYPKENILALISLIYKAYQEELAKLGAIDYDDLLFYAYKLLKENPKIRAIYQEKYLYIFEDEAQDSNKLQNKIIALLSGKHKNIVKVGDSNQSIMGTFTSSSPEIFRYFIRNAPIKKELSTSGRSNLEIIKLANLFQHYVNKKHPCIEARKALVKPYIKPAGTDNPQNINSIKQMVLEDEATEIKYLIYFVKNFHKKYPDKSIGILVPRNSLIKTLSMHFLKQEIDFNTLGDIDIQTIKTLQKLADILMFISEPFENKYLIKILSLYFLPKGEHLDKNIYKYLKTNSTNNILYETKTYEEDILNSTHFKHLKTCLGKLKLSLDFSINSHDKLLIYLGELFDFNLEEKALIENIALNLKKIFKLNPKWTLKDLISELKKTENNRLGFFSPKIKNTENNSAKITLCSYHKSKGREWDMLCLFGLNSFYFPPYLSQNSYGDKSYLHENYSNLEAFMNLEFYKYLKLDMQNNSILQGKIDKIQESIRLIFVGITRAKEYLFVSHNRERDTFYAPLFRSMLERIKND